jgi:hypothetical protein
MYKYNNATLSWQPANSGLPANGGIISIYADPDGVIHAGTYSDTYRSIDAGQSWSLFQAGVQRIVWDPARQQTAFMFGTSRGLERTLTGFATRAPFNTGLANNQFFGSLAIDVNGTTVYVGQTFKGVYRITN